MDVQEQTTGAPSLVGLSIVEREHFLAVSLYNSHFLSLFLFISCHKCVFDIVYAFAFSAKFLHLHLILHLH